MKTQIHPSGINLWLSANDTYNWANRSGSRWPCSQLSGRRLFCAFDRNGLCDISIDGGRGNQDVDCAELNAITSDVLLKRLPRSHPCWFVVVGQFLDLGIENKSKPEDLANWCFRIRRAGGDLCGNYFSQRLDCERAALLAIGVPH